MYDLYCDFEFSKITEPQLNLVCASALPAKGYINNVWLHKNEENKEDLAQYLLQFDTIICYSAIAEARSFISLGLDPLKFKWIDLFLEYRCLTNNKDEMQYGEQLVEGKVKKFHKPKPKWEKGPTDTADGFRPTHSLAEATFKLLGLIRDTKHKDEMRDLIISDPEDYSIDQAASVLKYCEDDVVLLPAMWEEIKKKFKRFDPRIDMEEYQKEAEGRGRFAALTAIMETNGYPIDVEKTKNFSQQVGNILYDCQREINKLFPGTKPFRWNKGEQRFSWDQTTTREWIKNNGYEKGWDLTDGGKSGKKSLSLSLDAFTKFFDFKHDYPTDNFGAQIVRFLKLKQSLYGFVPTADSTKKTFWDSVGSDGRVRPYSNIFGAQSSRSQPGSTGFMFLKPAWMRALVIPEAGMAMAGIDYGSEEYFIAALLSGDKKMTEAYLSGDVYLAFAKAAKIVPEDATKSSHKRQRDYCKSTVLGISYLMTKYGLAIKLSSDTGEKWTEDAAEDLITQFYDAYPKLKDFQDNIAHIYQEDEFIQLPDGWYMWGDNPNFRSVANYPVQGRGASIMRKAVDLAFSRGLYVPFTLHDALYIEYKVGDEYKIEILRDCMKEAFQFYFPEEDKELAGKIVLDPFAWSRDYAEDGELVFESGWKVPCSNLYVDDRSRSDYDKFSRYFNNREDIL
jgi:DNA polymerase-1